LVFIKGQHLHSIRRDAQKEVNKRKSF